VEVRFDDVTTLIGPNGVGKSTVLRALDWFFNGPQLGSISANDCTFGSAEQEIPVEVEFEQLTDNDRGALGHYVPEGVDTFVAWRVRDATGTERMTANAKAYAPFIDVRLAGGAKDVNAAYKALRENSAELGLPVARSAALVEEAMRTWELEHLDELVDAPADLTTTFFGFNSQGKMSGLFDYVLVTADLRAQEEVADSKDSVNGRILERAIDRSAADAEIAQLADAVSRQQSEIYARNFGTQLQELSTQLPGWIA